MTDETGNQLSSVDPFVNSSNNSNKPILVVNETGKVLYANPSCIDQFEIIEGQLILFDLESGGVRKSDEYSPEDNSTVPLIPYANINEMEFNGENCFGITLKQLVAPDKTPAMPPDDILNNEYQQMPGAIYQALDDEKLTITQITNGVSTLLGYAPEDLVNNFKFSFIDLVHPDDIDQVRNSRSEAIQSTNSFEITYRLRHSNGEYKMVSDQGRVLKSDMGMVQAIEGWLMPISAAKNFEVELFESESRLKFFIDASPDAVIYVDMRGQIRLVNPQFSRMLGIEENVDLLGVNVLSFLAPDEGFAPESEIAKTLASTNSHKGYYHAKTVSGQIIPIEVNIRALTSPNGQRTGFIGVVRDMSEWEQTIQSLKTSEAQYRAIVEDNPELIVRFNNDGVVTFCNQSYAGFYGLTVDDLVGQKLIDALPNSAKPIVQMILTYVSPNMEPTMKEVTHEGLGHDTRWHRWKTRAILNEKGSLIEYQSVGEDITNEKSTRQAHQISEQMIRSLLESIKLIAVMMDPTGRVTFVNSHFLDVTGWSRPEVLGENWMEKFVPPEVGFQLKKILFDSMVNGKVAQHNDNTILTRAGEQRLISWHNTLLFNDRHIAEGIAAIGEDVTERFYAEQTQEVVYKIAQASLTALSLEELYASLHKSLMGLMPAENFFIALYNRQTDIISYPYFVDQYDQCPEPAKPERGLTEYILRTGKTLLANPEVFNLLVEEDSVEPIGAACVDWLGVPLIVNNEVIGVMVTQSYTEGIRFKKRDEQMLTFVSTQVAMAIERKRAEQALLNSQRRSELLIEASTDGIFLESLDGKILDCNKVAARMYGYSPEELSNLNVRDLVSPDYLLDKPDYVKMGIGTWRYRNGYSKYPKRFHSLPC